MISCSIVGPASPSVSASFSTGSVTRDSGKSIDRTDTAREFLQQRAPTRLFGRPLQQAGYRDPEQVQAKKPEERRGHATERARGLCRVAALARMRCERLIDLVRLLARNSLIARSRCRLDQCAGIGAAVHHRLAAVTGTVERSHWPR